MEGGSKIEVTGISKIFANLYKYLTSVTIPKSVTYIGNETFEGCTGLTGIIIPDSVTSIGNGAFEQCTGLTGITIPDSVTSIGNLAFSNCTGLTSITLSNNVTEIEEWAFVNCKGLTSITIPGSLNSLERSVFNGCDSLTSATIPASVKSIDISAFAHCKNLKDVYYSGTKEQWVKALKGEDVSTGLQYAVIHCKDGDTKFQFPGSNPTPSQPETAAKPQQPAVPTPITNAAAVKAEDGNMATTTAAGTATLTEIARSNKKNVSVPSTVKINGVDYQVTEIGANAFKNQKKATTVTLPNTITKIKANAFNKSQVKTLKLAVNKGKKLAVDKKAFKGSKVQKIQITVSRKATEKEIKTLMKALKKAGIKEENIKISKKLK